MRSCVTPPCDPLSHDLLIDLLIDLPNISAPPTPQNLEIKQTYFSTAEFSFSLIPTEQLSIADFPLILLPVLPESDGAPLNASSAAPPNGWKIAKTIEIEGEAVPIPPPTLADCDRKSDLLAIYNQQKPSTWPAKDGLSMAEIVMVEEYESELAFAANRSAEEARAVAADRLTLALNYIKLKPDYYCQPNRKGQELFFKGFGWLFKRDRGGQGRNINLLAEQAMAINLNPSAVNQAFSEEFSGIPAALLGKPWFQEMVKNYNSPSTSEARKKKLFALIQHNIQHHLENYA